MQFGYLNLNSIPASNVVVDGRPLGQTPQVSEKLAAGSHSVVFIHPERGRRAQSVVLAPGARRTVAVRF
jgi:serine/threonine-protein kinase